MVATNCCAIGAAWSVAWWWEPSGDGAESEVSNVAVAIDGDAFDGRVVERATGTDAYPQTSLCLLTY